MIHGHTAIRDAYRSDETASRYVRERFEHSIGALLHRRQASILKEVLSRARPRRVLEIAPGPGRLSTEVVSAVRGTLVLADASHSMLQNAKRVLTGRGQSARFVEADGFDLPFPDASFDMVYTFRFIRHFELPNRVRLYREMARVLAPGGLVVFDGINELVSSRLRRQASDGEYEHYDALFTLKGLTAELEDAGFDVLSHVGVQHRYSLLRQIQVLVGPRSRRLADGLIELVDRSGGEPLEWVMTTRLRPLEREA
jgi:ubiquinone/menaquinone biosynthesis C-methylase UbiE